MQVLNDKKKEERFPYSIAFTYKGVKGEHNITVIVYIFSEQTFSFLPLFQ